MATKNLKRYPYESRYWYDHMGPLDRAIWERFIKDFPDMYDECEYDVAVGPGAPVDPTVNFETGGDINRLYQRKIDVVGFKGGEVDIIEIKPKAGPSAVGQIKFYRNLYFTDFKPARLPKLVIVTDELRQGMAEYCFQEGVQLVVV